MEAPRKEGILCGVNIDFFQTMMKPNLETTVGWYAEKTREDVEILQPETKRLGRKDP